MHFLEVAGLNNSERVLRGRKKATFSLITVEAGLWQGYRVNNRIHAARRQNCWYFLSNACSLPPRVTDVDNAVEIKKLRIIHGPRKEIARLLRCCCVGHTVGVDSEGGSSNAAGGQGNRWKHPSDERAFGECACLKVRSTVTQQERCGC